MTSNVYMCDQTDNYEELFESLIEEEDLQDDKNILKNDIIKYVLNNNITDNHIDKIVKKNKNKNDMRFIYNNDHYKNRIYDNVNENSIDNLDIELEFVENNEQLDIWKFFRINTYLVYDNKSKNKIIRILVKDKITQKYIGIIKLSNDYLSEKDKNKYIEW